MKKAFTMVELIFVIVIIGILSAVAVPKLMATRDDALIAKNIEYISASMAEISSYMISKGKIKDDLIQMSSMLKVLKSKNRVISDVLSRSVSVKIGDENSCITIKIDSNGTTETLKTKFLPATTDRICYMVQQSIKEKSYPLILRGQLIKY